MPFDVLTAEEKTVAEYAGLSLFDVLELGVFDYWMLLHDAVVWNHASTKEGRQWLKNAHRLACADPDEAAVERKLREGGATHGR